MPIDVKGINENFKRRVSSIATCIVDFADFATDTVVNCASMPKNCIVTGVYLVIDSPAQAAVTLTTKIGATTILAAQLADAVADTVHSSSTNEELFRTGGDLSLTASATPTQGKFTINVEYIEFARTDGTMTAL